MNYENVDFVIRDFIRYFCILFGNDGFRLLRIGLNMADLALIHKFYGK